MIASAGRRFFSLCFLGIWRRSADEPLLGTGRAGNRISSLSQAPRAIVVGIVVFATLLLFVGCEAGTPEAPEAPEASSPFVGFWTWTGTSGDLAGVSITLSVGDARTLGTLEVPSRVFITINPTGVLYVTGRCDFAYTSSDITLSNCVFPLFRQPGDSISDTLGGLSFSDLENTFPYTLSGDTFTFLIFRFTRPSSG